jgi:hypothetical protein
MRSKTSNLADGGRGGRMVVAAALVAAGTAAVFLAGAIDGGRAVAAGPPPAGDAGIGIAEQPLFGALSGRWTTGMAAAFARLAGMPPGTRAATVARLQACADLPTCVSLLDGLGFPADGLRRDASEGRQVAAAAGLTGAGPVTVETSFRHAQLLVDGVGAASELLAMVQAAGVPCAGDCPAALGNALGAAKGTALARSSQALPTTGGGSGGGSGGTLDDAGQVIAVAKDVIQILGDLLDAWYDSDEEDKECQDDSDCAPNEQCDKVGENDCRPKLHEGELCSRGGECLSNCCKPHISAGFLPICRPADKCN